MSTPDNTGKLGKAVKDHPALSALALFAIAGAAGVITVRRRAVKALQNVQQPTDAQFAEVRDDDEPLKPVTTTGGLEFVDVPDGNNDDGGDPITKAVRG